MQWHQAKCCAQEGGAFYCPTLHQSAHAQPAAQQVLPQVAKLQSSTLCATLPMPEPVDSTGHTAVLTMCEQAHHHVITTHARSADSGVVCSSSWTTCSKATSALPCALVPQACRLLLQKTLAGSQPLQMWILQGCAPAGVYPPADLMPASALTLDQIDGRAAPSRFSADLRLANAPSRRI